MMWNDRNQSHDKAMWISNEYSRRFIRKKIKDSILNISFKTALTKEVKWHETTSMKFKCKIQMNVPEAS